MKNPDFDHDTKEKQVKLHRKQNWCISAILALIFGTLTAAIFFYIVLFGAGNDGYVLIFCIYTAPVALIFGLWGVFYWRSSVAALGLALTLSPLVAFKYI